MELNIFAMPPSTILLLLSAVFGMSNALPWSGPIPTSVYKADEWSPRPTNIPENPRDLFKRAQVDVAVCGWVGGNEKNPAVCPTGSSCIHDMAHGYVGCCTTAGKCTAGVYTGCVDKNSPGGNTGPAVENNGIYTCQGDSVCYQNLYPRGYSQWGCGKTEQATSIETTYEGQPSDVLLQIVYTRMTFRPVTLSSTSTTSSSTSSSPVTTTTDSNVKTTTPSTPTTVNPDPNAAGASPGATSTTSVVEDDSGKSKNKVNGGIVAAGVIGTGAFIIALLAIVLFFLRRRRKQQENNSNSGGSFMSIKGGEVGAPIGAPVPASPASTQATFPRAIAYSPDDFRTMASTAGASPPMDPSRSVYAPEEYQGIEQRMRENADLAVPPQPYYQSPSLDGDGLPRVSEIDNFSHSFHAAIAQMSPPTPPQAQMSNVSPPSSRGYTSHAPEGAAGIAMGAIAGGAVRRDSRSHGGNGYGPIEEDDYGQQDSYIPGDDYGRVLADNYGPPDEYEDDYVDSDAGPVEQYDPINKEMGMATVVKAPPSYTTVPGFRSENVRREGWEPAGLQVNRELTPPPRVVERVSDGTPRYQLVDQPPVGSVPVLHSPGQLRGQNKGARQKQGYDGKNGDDLQA